MRKHLFKLLLISALLTLPKINLTNSFFTSQAAINTNIMSTGCWSAPSVPILTYPLNNTFSNSTWNANPYMDWSNSTSFCSTAGQITYQYESYLDSNLNQLAYRSNWLSNSFISAPGTPHGTYFWRVRSKDSLGHISAFSSPWKLIVDKNLPSSVITTPLSSEGNNNFQFNSPTIWFWDGSVTGTASDDLSGVNSVELSIYQEGQGYWNGSTWLIGGTEESTRVIATGTNSWNYQITPTSISPGDFKIVSHAIDNAGNVESSAIIEFKYVNSPPCTPTTTLTSTDKRASFTVSCISDFLKLGYELIYISNDIPKGLIGTISLNKDSQISRDETLGTCSSFGKVCTYDTNVSKISLDITLTKENGEVVKISKEI